MQTAEIVAAGLGVDVVVREGLREYGVGALAGTDTGERDYFEEVFRQWVGGDDTTRIAGGERIEDFVARVAGVLAEVADAHRVRRAWSSVTAARSSRPVLQLVGLPRTRGLGVTLPNCGVIEVEKDADRWLLDRRIPSTKVRQPKSCL